MSSVALLTFTRNDVARALPMLRKVRPHVAELVVVDSSDPPDLARHQPALASLGATVVRAVPVGYVDVLRPFGTSLVRSEWVFLVEADEIPTGELCDALPRLVEGAAYDLPRLESGLGSWTRSPVAGRRSAPP